ncbi:MAG: ATP-binding protein [Planctomycetes bacterium]|nr:ATP-binding protein [Planctomycetota bacterium]
MQFIADAPPDLGEVIHEREIPSAVELIAPLVIRLNSFLVERGLLREADKGILALCLDEAMRNAILHGNEGEFRKKVRLRIVLGSEMWWIVIEDEGPGFAPNQIPDAEQEDSLWLEGGRGIRLIEHFMDEVRFYRNGSCIAVGKHLL